MKATVFRKAPFFKRLPQNKLILKEDFEISIVYARFLTKKIINRAEGFKVSLDFKDFERTSPVMRYFPDRALLKIASRHGLDLENEVLGVVVDFLDDEIKDILTALALRVRYMKIYTKVFKEDFEFLLENAGIFPEFDEICLEKDKITVFLGEEFLIKICPDGNTYYDVSLTLPDFLEKQNLPEGYMIFSEYVKINPYSRENVKIRELMSK